MNHTPIRSEVICKNCGLVNDYSVEKKSNQHVATCNGCGNYIKNISYAVPMFYIGKYKGQKVADVNDKNYLLWFLDNVKKISPHLKEAIENKLKQWE